MSRLSCVVLVMVSMLCWTNAIVSAHEHHAPHKGTLVELGEEFAHLEVVLDAATGKVTVYFLDGCAENAVRSKESKIELKFSKIDGKESTLKLELKANEDVLTGEKAGDSSEFSAQDNGLKNVKEFVATVTSVTLKGKTFENVKISFPKGNEADKTK